MTSGEAEYTVNLAELADATSCIDQFVQSLVQAHDHIESAVAQRCQEVWTGVAATAYQERHQRWSKNMVSANRELAELKAAAQRAHNNYSTARQANRDMLGR
ncbi:MAG: WXG100 family type VII secretion target [Mycobacteriaceae bacterium]